MSALNIALALWILEFVSEENLIRWVDQKIAEEKSPSCDLIELSLYGPSMCLKRAQDEFSPRPEALTFAEEFSLHAVLSDLSSDESAARFIRWSSLFAMGKDQKEPVVRLSYYLQHLACDCDDMRAAIRHLKEELPAVMPGCQSVAAAILSRVQGMELESNVPYSNRRT